MKGRYTRFLSDGLPLFGQQGGGLGLLQIPPMDLGQVEVIKGAASALYGAGAISGIFNLIARRPTEKPVHEVLLNRSSLGATDASVFLASKLSERWGASILGGGHFQERQDLDGDGWPILPDIRAAFLSHACLGQQPARLPLLPGGILTKIVTAEPFPARSFPNRSTVCGSTRYEAL